MDPAKYVNAWWFRWLPWKLQQKIMARNYWKTAGRKTR